MRLLYVTPYLPRRAEYGGLVRMFNMIKELATLGHEITLISFFEREEERRFLPDLEASCENVEIYLRRPRRAPRLLSLKAPCVVEFGDPRMRARVAEELRGGRHDLVSIECSQLAPLGELPRGTARASLTVQEVNFSAKERLARVAESRRARLRAGIERLVWLKFELRAFQRFESVVFMTDEDRGAVKRYLPELRSEVVNCGVGMERRAAREMDDVEPQSVCFMGGYRHTPNVDAVLWFVRETMPLVWARWPGARFDVIGPDAPDCVRELASDPRVNVRGFVQELAPALAREAVFVAPIRLGNGMRCKVLEAWAAGLPVVATSLALAGVGARRSEGAIVAETPSELAAALDHLFANPDLACRLGEGGRRLVEERFTYPALARRLAAHYESLIGG